MNYLLILSFVTSIFSGVFTSDVENEKTKVVVEITNLRNSKGSVSLGVYTNQDDFDDEKEYVLEVFPKAKTDSNGKLTVELYLAPGTYGIAYLDDENNNGEMDFGLMLPKEGFGFSNYVHSGLSRPDFEDFQFTVGTQTTKVKIQTKYM